MRDTIIYQPVGIVYSGHTDPEKTPIQPVFAEGFSGQVEIFKEYEKGLKDIEGFSHIIIFYHFHMTKARKLLVKPFLENAEHGVFATRSPCRPNPIGISLVRLVKRVDNILMIDDVDILDSTPVLDIKPYVSRFDSRDNVRSGWQANIDDETAYKLGRRV